MTDDGAISHDGTFVNTSEGELCQVVGDRPGWHVDSRDAATYAPGGDWYTIIRRTWNPNGRRYGEVWHLAFVRNGAAQFTQLAGTVETLEAVTAGCEAAWGFFGGVFRVLIPDNMSPVVADADAVNPRFTLGWLDYAQHCGFATDPARVRHAKDKPRVERAVQYVRSSFFAGEQFVGLVDAQSRARLWCRDRAGQRVHGTTQARPAQVFTEHEAGLLLPVPPTYDVPVFKTVKVHRDFHVEVGKALYSVPKAYIGQYLDVRADSALVKLFHHGQLVKVHPRQRPGGRWTDPDDYPPRKSATRCGTWTG